MTKNTAVTKPGSLRAWLDFLEKIDPNKITLGLERVSKVLKSLNLDLSDTKIIEVAGTNGKGSTAALVAASLTSSGISSGLYTSPHLNAFNERIVINGVPVKDDDLCEAFSCVYDARGDVPLSYFEYTTLAAIVCFIKANVKVMVLEIGLGGRLDAVNALDADIAVITSIGLDHTAILGKTIKEIAGEKAGIIKKECAVVTGILSNEALLTVKEKCKEQNATLYAEGTDFYGKFTNGFDFVSVGKLASFTIHLPYPKIPKCCAPAALKVITLLREMGYKITLDAIEDAVKRVSLPGRMQLVSLKPVIYLDVAHNPPAAAHLVEVLKERQFNAKRYAVIGMLKDKDIESVIKEIVPVFDGFYVATLHTQRGESAQRLVSAINKCLENQSLVKSFEYVKDALDTAVKECSKDDEIIVMGSFVTVSEAIEALGKRIKE